MNTFWKWLMRANAKGVFYCALLGLLAVSAWWTWREFSPDIQPAATPPVGAGSKLPEPRTLGVLDFVKGHLASDVTAVPGNPFMSSDAPWHWEPNIKRHINVPREVAAPPPPAVEAAPPPAPTFAPPPGQTAPPRPTVAAAPEPPAPAAPAAVVTPVVLTYRGTFRRPDGKLLALIEDSESQRGVFYGSGDELFGVKLTGIQNEAASLETADGGSVSLKLREPRSFVEGKPHAN